MGRIAEIEIGFCGDAFREEREIVEDIGILIGGGGEDLIAERIEVGIGTSCKLLKVVDHGTLPF